ncbi:MAG TPA: hypothetical protein PLG95_06090 [Methanoculleus sp.]|nr:hypothetical protein [Methanoculleus sp.]
MIRDTMHWAIYFTLIQGVQISHPIAGSDAFCQKRRGIVTFGTGASHNRDDNIEISEIRVLVIDRVKEAFQEPRDKGFVRLQSPDLVAENVVREFFLKEVLPERPDANGRVVSIWPVLACRTVGKSTCKTIGYRIAAYPAVRRIEDLKFRSIRPEENSFHISSL